MESICIKPDFRRSSAYGMCGPDQRMRLPVITGHVEQRLCNGDLDRFERLGRQRVGLLNWSLYTAHGRFTHR